MLPWLRTARSRRFGLAAVLAALLVLLGVVVVRSLPTAPPRAVATATHRVTSTVRTYPRHIFDIDLSLLHSAHPGDTYALAWQPIVVATDPITGPTPLACLLEFFGPYATGAVAVQVMQNVYSARGTTGLTPAFAAPPLSLDALSGTLQQEMVTLPDNLASGWYLVVAQSGNGVALDSVLATYVLKIVPRGA